MFNITHHKFDSGVLLALCSTMIVAVLGHHTGLFWDNILFVSRMSRPLLENGLLSWGTIPLDSDPGHPPFVATYLVAVWSIFGRSLAVSHWALYPFVFIFYYELWHVIKHYFTNRNSAFAAYLLVFADPTVFSQLMYIGPETCVLCFASMAMRGILSGDIVRKTIGLSLLGICSMRGMMLCAGLFLWDMICKVYIERQSARYLLTWRNMAPYVIGSLPAVSFVLWRLLCKGWLIDNPIHPWGQAWDYNTLAEFLCNILRNIIVFGQRITDFGRMVPILVCFVLLVYCKKTKCLSNQDNNLIIFCLTSCSVVAVASLLIHNAMGHNYFTLLYIGIECLLVSFLSHIRWQKIPYIVSLFALLLGNLIVYPDRFSQGWASSLASLPYWTLRDNVLSYMDANHIQPEQTLCYFPFGRCADDVDLNDDIREYASSWEKATYVIASNINNLDDGTLDRIQSCCTPIYRVEKSRVHITLYRITP